MTHNPTPLEGNPFAVLSKDMSDLPDVIPETQILQLGQEAYNTPRANLFSDNAMPSSPLFEFSQRTAQFPMKGPPTKKRRPQMAPDTDYQIAFHGTPSSIQEAVTNAANLIGKALHLTTNTTERSQAMELIQHLEDFSKGRPMARIVDNLTTAINSLEKTTKTLRNSRPTPAPATSTGSSTPRSSNNGTESSTWSPSNQLRTEQIKQALHTTNSQLNIKPKPTNLANPNSKKPTRRQRRLILTKKTPLGFNLEDSLQPRNVINRAIGKLMVASVALSMTNNIILTTTYDYTAEDLIKQQQHLKKVFDYQEARIDDEWTKIIAHGIPLKPANGAMDGNPINMNSLEGLKLVKEEIQIFNKHLNLDIVDNVRWLSTPAKREISSKASVVITVKNPEQATRAIRHGLLILGIRPRLEKLNGAQPKHQCNNCQRYGHYNLHCKNPAKCAICGEDHQTNNHSCNTCEASGAPCAHTIWNCSNCKGNHGATDPKCENRPIQRPRFNNNHQ